MKNGDKVVCIRTSSGTFNGITMTVIKGEIYTCSGAGDYDGYIKTFETGEWSCNINLFRPVDDTFGEVVAEIIEKMVEVEEMETV